MISKKEEIANAVTHGIGVVFSLAALVLLIVFAAWKGTPLSIVSVTVYGITMLLLFLASTLYHSFQGKVKALFKIFDHSAIYLFIAGTYTPIVLNIIKGFTGWLMFGIVWGIALLGTIFKIFLVKKFKILSTLIYIMMGWLIIFAWQPLSTTFQTQGLILLVIGGITYTVGTIFYGWRKLPYNHAVWHVFVLAGSVLHFLAILLFAIPAV